MDCPVSLKGQSFGQSVQMSCGQRGGPDIANDHGVRVRLLAFAGIADVSCAYRAHTDQLPILPATSLLERVELMEQTEPLRIWLSTIIMMGRRRLG